jgi:hypothetical protein
MPCAVVRRYLFLRGRPKPGNSRLRRGQLWSVDPDSMQQAHKARAYWAIQTLSLR